MGQKAKNAGKKQSKTCNKNATSKSVCGGKALKAVALTPIQHLELQLMDVGRNGVYRDGRGKCIYVNI